MDPFPDPRILGQRKEKPLSLQGEQYYERIFWEKVPKPDVSGNWGKFFSRFFQRMELLSVSSLSMICFKIHQK
jgi:hypothetical protein